MKRRREERHESVWKKIYYSRQLVWIRKTLLFNLLKTTILMVAFVIALLAVAFYLMPHKAHVNLELNDVDRLEVSSEDVDINANLNLVEISDFDEIIISPVSFSELILNGEPFGNGHIRIQSYYSIDFLKKIMFYKPGNESKSEKVLSDVHIYTNYANDDDSVLLEFEKNYDNTVTIASPRDVQYTMLITKKSHLKTKKMV